MQLDDKAKNFIKKSKEAGKSKEETMQFLTSKGYDLGQVEQPQEPITEQEPESLYLGGEQGLSQARDLGKFELPVDIAEGLIPVGGAIAGGLGGLAVGGPVGAIIGAGIGGGLGMGARRGAEILRGEKPLMVGGQEQITGYAGDVGKEALLSASGEALGLGLLKGLQPLSKATSPAISKLLSGIPEEQTKRFIDLAQKVQKPFKGKQAFKESVEDLGKKFKATQEQAIIPKEVIKGQYSDIADSSMKVLKDEKSRLGKLSGEFQEQLKERPDITVEASELLDNIGNKLAETEYMGVSRIPDKDRTIINRITDDLKGIVSGQKKEITKSEFKNNIENIKVPVGKNSYTRHAKKGRFWTKNVTDPMQRAFNIADEELNNVLSVLQKNPETINNISKAEALEKRIEKAVADLPDDPDVIGSYFDKFNLGLGNASEHIESLSRTQVGGPVTLGQLNNFKTKWQSELDGLWREGGISGEGKKAISDILGGIRETVYRKAPNKDLFNANEAFAGYMNDVYNPLVKGLQGQGKSTLIEQGLAHPDTQTRNAMNALDQLTGGNLGQSAQQIKSIAKQSKNIEKLLSNADIKNPLNILNKTTDEIEQIRNLNPELFEQLLNTRAIAEFDRPFVFSKSPLISNRLEQESAIQTQNMLRGILGAGGGFTTGGPLGLATATAVQSPKLQANIIRELLNPASQKFGGAFGAGIGSLINDK